MSSGPGFDRAVARVGEVLAARERLVERARAVPDVAALAALAATVTDPDVAGQRLLPLLEASPALGGKVASRRRLAAAGLAEDVTLDRVTAADWDRLVGGA